MYRNGLKADLIQNKNNEISKMFEFIQDFLGDKFKQIEFISDKSVFGNQHIKKEITSKVSERVAFLSRFIFLLLLLLMLETISCVFCTANDDLSS